MSTPSISIITPAYNAEEFIAETIQSILAQTFSGWEWLIMDDGSTDDTATIIKKYAESDNRIKYLYQPNAGMGKARNEAISHSIGKYLAFVDADDLWHPEKLKLQMETMEREAVDLVYTQGWVFENSTENKIREIKGPTGKQNYNSLFLKQLYGYSLPILSVMVKKDKITMLGGFEESRLSHFAADYQMWLRLMDNNSLFFGMPEYLVYYRIHSKQATHNDNLALGPVLWAMEFANLKSISVNEKKKAMNQRLNRYLLHEMDNLTMEKRDAMTKLYLNPLKRPLHYFFFKLSPILGNENFKKLAYRFLDLKENNN